MGKAKHHRAAAEQQVQAAVKPEIKLGAGQSSKFAGDSGKLAGDSGKAAVAAATQDLKWAIVGNEVKIQKDYLDMKNVPSENGLENGGYLVLRRGDMVRILYVGSAQTDDAGWLYGEVTKTSSRGCTGRRGWFPSAVAEPPPEVPSITPAAMPAAIRPAPAAQVRTSCPAAAAVAPRPAANASASTAAQSGAARGRKQKSQAQAQAFQNDAFPALPGHSGTAPSWWDEEEEDEVPSVAQASRTVGSSTPSAPRDVQGTIARHRAVAAAAAAKAQAKVKSPVAKSGAAPKKGGASKSEAAAACPICMESFSTQRRPVQLPCCGVELCMLCSEKSLKSSRCYFCREEKDEFPSLVTSTGR